ncbi:MAG TPA: hypothetical protein VJB16_06640 [archaeon]|nr:hypothetical protein [archaeon]
MALIQNWVTYPSRIASDAAALGPEHLGRRARVVAGMLGEGLAAGLAVGALTGDGELGAYAAVVPVLARIGQLFYYRPRQ